MKALKMRAPACALVAGLSLSGAAQAALHDRGGGLIYDDVLNVTWLADASYAQTSGHDADGLMTLSAAFNWVSDLSYSDSMRNATYTDWRLPTTLDQSCFGYGCTGSEMGHLYYSELGGTSTASLASMHGPQYDLFENIQAGGYWSGTAYELNGVEYWQFDFGGGYQAHNFVYQDLGGEYPMENLYYPEMYAWAIRDGDVAAVPEAETYALMLAGLALVGWRVHRRGSVSA